MTFLNTTTYTRGLIAELYAMLFLVVKGYRIRAWRYKTPVGEVDIIAQRGKTIAFVEVKLRPNLDSGMEAVTHHMRYRISRASTHFMVFRAGKKAHFSRFDVIAVSGFRLRHLDNAWNCTT